MAAVRLCSAAVDELTKVLNALEPGDPQAASRLLPLVYDELRKLAAQKLARERPGQTLDATALVHEAYLRLVTPPLSPPSQGGGSEDVPTSAKGGSEDVPTFRRGGKCRCPHLRKGKK